MSSPDPTYGEALVAQGALVVRYENEALQTFAIAHPRDEEEVKTKALALLDRDPDAAETAYYAIPYKDHTKDAQTGCTRRSDDNCPIGEVVEGVGIDGARELARLWGNNATRVYFTDETDDWVRMSGVFTDLETNTRLEVPFAVAKYGVGRNAEVYSLNPSRLAMAVQGGVSKCARNAINQALPKWLTKAYHRHARGIVAKSGALDVEKLLQAFASLKRPVTRDELEKLYAKPIDELDEQDRGNLRGLYAAFREDILDADRYFESGGSSESSLKGGGAAAAPPPAPAAGSQEGGPAASATTSSREPEPSPAEDASPETRPGVDSPDADPSQGTLDGIDGI